LHVHVHGEAVVASAQALALVHASKPQDVAGDG
jgi:hypothetical protein